MKPVDRKIPFEIVNFEIVGFCNAKCPYCPTGNGTVKLGRTISVDLFRKTIDKLLANKTIDKNTVLYLYNWGEPLLHPKFHEIVDIVNEKKLSYAISTNASLLRDMDEGLSRNLKELKFSMSGFSQRSYDRIHQLDFEQVIANIRGVSKKLKELRWKGKLEIAYHVYRFNFDEIRACEKFANEIGAVFSPYYATMVDWNMLTALVNHKLTPEQRTKIESELFHEFIDEVVSKKPGTFDCPRKAGALAIDETGDIITCCWLDRLHKDYAVGNINDSGDIAGLLEKKQKMPICNWCEKSGLAYYTTVLLKSPHGYSPDWKQKMVRLNYRLRHKIDSVFHK